MNHDVVHIQLWIQLSPLFQLQPLSIASIIMELTWAFHRSVRTFKDILYLVALGVDSCQLLDHQFTIPPIRVKSITGRHIADWYLWVNVFIFISATCTTAAAPTGCKRGIVQTEHGTCSLPLYRWRYKKQVKTCSRMRSWIASWLCGRRRCGSNNGSYSMLSPIVCSS